MKYVCGLKAEFLQGFSTSASRAADLAKLTLIGRLGKDPEVKTTKTDKEYVTYVLKVSLRLHPRLTHR